MAESLNPTPLTRLLTTLRPDWSRTLRARRVVAGGLVVLAGVAAIRPDSRGATVPVVVASRDIRPGAALTGEDVALAARVAVTVPDGAPTDLASVLGATPTGPIRRGEVLTDVRVLGPRLTAATAGPDTRVVPVHPADGALADLLRPGDVVDVIAAPGADPPAGPRVVAAGGIVVLVSDRGPGSSDEPVVLVALPAAAAHAVAGATLVESVTLTLR